MSGTATRIAAQGANQRRPRAIIARITGLTSRRAAASGGSSRKADGADPDVTDQESLRWGPPHFVGTELVDQLPVEPALMMMNPDRPPDMLRKHDRKIPRGERVADHQDRRPVLARRDDMVRHDLVGQRAIHAPQRKNETLRHLAR